MRSAHAAARAWVAVGALLRCSATPLFSSVSPHSTPLHATHPQIVIPSSITHPPQFLPRKFKVAVTVPGDNSVDVFTNDIGVVVITDSAGQLQGYNLLVRRLRRWFAGPGVVGPEP